MRTTKLFDGWKGMAPDSPRDNMNKGQIWRMRDYLPRVLGSQLESRSPWTYYAVGPLSGPVRAQKWITTLGMNHHLAVTADKVYNLDVPASPRVVETIVSGGDNPLAQLYEFVCVPRNNDQSPKFYKYTSGSSVETPVTADASIPKAKHVCEWNGYFVLANSVSGSQFGPENVFWLEQNGWTPAITTTPAWDVNAWVSTTSDVTALAKTRTSLLVFHAASVERFRGGIPPGSQRDDDLIREPLIGLGGCTQPQTVCYWNDSVLFCDGRGAYLTDGTTIRDISAQGGISRAWRQRYTSTLRLSAGIYADFWIITALDTAASGQFIDCWVCDLYTRNWMLFTNIPCASMVTATDTNEHLYGGTWDGKIIDLSRMWDEQDPTTANLDANGTAVLPYLELPWYGLSKNSDMKRIKNAEIAYELTEDSGTLDISFAQSVHPATSDWILMRSCRMRDQDALAVDTRGLVRRRLPIGYEHYGMTFKLATTGQLKNLKIYDFSVEGPIPREESYS